MTTDSFHAGEQVLQQRAGSREQLALLGPRIVRDHMPDQHRELFAQLPTLLLATLDAQGRPQATMLAGPPGFISSPDPRSLLIAQAQDAEDPVLRALRPGVPVGVLGLQPHTRRRNRMNGLVAGWDADGLVLAVKQSFGNCPKYIQAREPLPRAAEGQRPPARILGPGLDAAARALIARSDTLFIASASARPEAATQSEGVDVSHRGGPPGFVEIETLADGGLLLGLADYPGNQFFMTLGNLSLNPAAGLLFVDHEDGGLLHLSADAQIAWAGEHAWLRLHVRGGLWRPGVLPWQWTAPQLAPQFHRRP